MNYLSEKMEKNSFRNWKYIKKNDEYYGIETIDKQSINKTISNYNTEIDALKYRELKTYGFNDKLNIKLKNRFPIINNHINNYNSIYFFFNYFLIDISYF